MDFDRRQPGGSSSEERSSDELRDILAWLGESSDAPASAEYTPAVDVIERGDAIEIVADVPGVRRDAIRVVFTNHSVVIAGRKVPPGCEQREAAFHVAERRFGLFARVIRLTIAVDATRARASLRSGELHVSLPRIDDRRGRGIPIAIDAA
jgi:HSP20 family protein